MSDDELKIIGSESAARTSVKNKRWIPRRGGTNQTCDPVDRTPLWLVVLAVGAVASLITTIAGTYPVPPLALGVLMMALTIIVGATTRAIENK
jgi:hypothetical protein